MALAVTPSLQRDFRVVFEDLIAVVESGSISSDQLAEFSRRFQQALRDATALTSNPNASVTDDEAQRVAAMYRCWHLCDIFFTRGDSISKMGGFVLGELLKWSAEHFAEADRLRLKLVRRKSDFDQDPAFWPAVTHLVCQGRMKEASQLLQLHSEYPKDEMVTNAVRTVEELTRRMPVYHPGTSRTDFMGKWQHWYKHVQDRTSNITDPPLRLLADLFLGKEEAYSRLLHDMRMHWMEVFVAKLLFTQPTVMLVDIQSHLVNQNWAELDLLYDILCANTADVLTRATQEFGSHIFSAHLFIFLSQTNWLTEEGKEEESEELMLEYGRELVNVYRWSAAASYLSRCGEAGLELLKETLLSIYMRTEHCATQVWYCCRKSGMPEAAAQVCRRYGERMLEAGKLVTAITWFIRGGASDHLTRLADDLLVRYSKTHDARELSVAQQFSDAAASCQRLQFAAKYKDIRDHVANGGVAYAARAVIEIFTETTLAPKWFWIHMLMDLVPLLENDDILFSSFDTRSLIQCLEEVELSHCRELFLSTVATNGEEEIEKIRMALARNLARSLLVQPSS